MSKILTPKGWRDLIIEKKKDFDVDIDMEPRVRNPFLKRGVRNSEFISQPDAKEEGFGPNVKFMHYHMGKNQEDHFETDAEQVFPAYNEIKGRKFYAVISKFRESVFIMHHVFASSPLDAFNRYRHVTMQIGTHIRRFSPEKKIPSGVKVVPHKQGNVKDVYRVAKRFVK